MYKMFSSEHIPFFYSFLKRRNIILLEPYQTHIDRIAYFPSLLQSPIKYKYPKMRTIFHIAIKRARMDKFGY